jgi:hypothetical protein
MHARPWLNKFVLPTGAPPDFLPSMKIAKATKLNRKYGAAERSAVALVMEPLP